MIVLPTDELTEKQWEAMLFSSKEGLAVTLGWDLRYHTLRSKGSAPGFPDWVLVRERVIYVEMKREGGKPTDRQRTWLDRLAAAGAEAYLWRPSDLAEAGRVLNKRWTLGRDIRHAPYLFTNSDPLFRPRSLWPREDV